MIYTVTFNPALDYIVRVDDLKLGEVNRVTYEDALPGGKGVNVSIVLANLGHASRALGFVADFTGAEIERRMRAYGAECDFVRVEGGMSRINVKMKSTEETEVNGLGPAIADHDIEALYAQLDALGTGDYLVIAGSVPSTLPSNMYERVMERLEGRGVCVAVDAERDLLTRVLKYQPFVIKPNNHELGDIFGTKITRRDEAVPYARKLQERGARNVIVSMADEGAAFVGEDGSVIESEAPRGVVVNSVGAGDSMVAGFLAGWIETGDYAQAFRMGLCTGSASAFSPGLATRPEVEALLKATQAINQ